LGFDGDGTDDSVVVNDSSTLDINNSVSVQAWVKWNVFKNYGVLFEKGSSGSGVTFNYAVWSYVDNITGIIGNGSTSISTGALATSTAPIGTWHRVALTADGSRLKLFINSSVVKNVQQTIALTPNNYNFFIGAGQSNGYVIDGYIDDVRIYNRALSDAEIRAIYNATR
jgi:hypothetical protein